MNRNCVVGVHHTSSDTYTHTHTHTHTMDYYSDIKKNKVLPFAITWTDLEAIILKENRKREILCDITYM